MRDPGKVGSALGSVIVEIGVVRIEWQTDLSINVEDALFVVLGYVLDGFD